MGVPPLVPMISPTLQTGRPPKNTLALVLTAVLGVTHELPPGVVPGAGVCTSPPTITGSPPTKYLPDANPIGPITQGGVLQLPVPPLSGVALYTAIGLVIVGLLPQYVQCFLQFQMTL